jgi:hypothetical protein
LICTGPGSQAPEEANNCKNLSDKFLNLAFSFIFDLNPILKFFTRHPLVSDKEIPSIAEKFVIVQELRKRVVSRFSVDELLQNVHYFVHVDDLEAIL